MPIVCLVKGEWFYKRIYHMLRRFFYKIEAELGHGNVAFDFYSISAREDKPTEVIS
jgi:hypothetical protein